MEGGRGGAHCTAARHGRRPGSGFAAATPFTVTVGRAVGGVWSECREAKRVAASTPVHPVSHRPALA